MRVQSRVRAGRAAWDEPSAQYAIELARAQERLPQPFGRFGNVRAMWILAAVMWLNVAIRVADHDGALGTILYLVAACGFSVAAFRLPAWERNWPKAYDLNAPLLTSATPQAEAPPTVTRDQEVTGMAAAALLFGVPFGIGTGVADDSWIVGVLGGAFFGVFMVVGMRWFYRRGR